MLRREFIKAASAAALAALYRSTPSTGPGAGTSPITNHWTDDDAKRHILSEKMVFQGVPGAAYNHHQQVLYDRGRIFVSWSNGIQNEDNPGQRMMLVHSDDGGDTFSEPREITPPPPEKTSAFTAMGLRSYKGMLIAYYGHYAYNESVVDDKFKLLTHFAPDFRNDPTKWVHRDSYAAVRVSTDRGATWGEPKKILDRFVPNLRPQPTRTGRLIMPGNIAFPYTDDPAGLTGWKFVGLPRLPKWTVDDPEGFHKACASRGDAQNYCEGSFFQDKKGILHMMLRTTPLPGDLHDGLLAVSESRDNGKTWSEPQLTSFTDSSCRFHFGQLPDGRNFGLNDSAPKGPRSPMVLSLSSDGINFTDKYILGDVHGLKPRLPGGDKDKGAYGYPSCDIANGTMYIVYSRCKEDIYFGKLDLNSLS